MLIRPLPLAFFSQLRGYPLELLSDIICGGSLETLQVLSAGGGWRERFQGDADDDGTFVPAPTLAWPPGSTSISHLSLVYCTFSKREMQIILYVPDRSLRALFASRLMPGSAL